MIVVVHTHSIASIRKAQVLLLERVQLTTNIELHNRQLRGGDRAREHVALLLTVELAARNSIVDGFADGVADESEGCASVGNGSVVRESDALSVDSGRCRRELPESLRVVDGSVVDLSFTDAGVGQDVLVDIAECVESKATVRVVGVAPAVEVGGEEGHVGRDVTLGDHVLYRSLNRSRCDGVDGTWKSVRKVLVSSHLRINIPHARQRRPSPVSCWNSVESTLASSTAWFLMRSPPTVTLSVPTSPEALLPSP